MDGSAETAAAIRPATQADAASIARINNPYVLGPSVTFEAQRASFEEIARRLGEVVFESSRWFDGGIWQCTP